MNRHPLQHQNSSVRRERDLRALARLALQLGFALLLTGGFVFAAGQHLYTGAQRSSRNIDRLYSDEAKDGSNAAMAYFAGAQQRSF